MPSILLVDDEPLVMRLVARVIESLGFTPRFAGNGPEALEEMAREAPALVLTDYHMPGMTGVELVKALAEAGHKTCPVILVSGDDDGAILRGGLAAGADDFLVKGMPFSVLTERVRFWTQGPFRALPEHIRRAALDTLARLEPPDMPVVRLRRGNAELAERAAIVMADQVLAAGPGFGAHPADRVRFLAVLDAVLAILARTCALAQLQRADALVDVVRRLDPPWAGALLAEEMPRLTALRQGDMAFAHAAARLSVSVSDSGA